MLKVKSKFGTTFSCTPETVEQAVDAQIWNSVEDVTVQDMIQKTPVIINTYKVYDENDKELDYEYVTVLAITQMIRKVPKTDHLNLTPKER